MKAGKRTILLLWLVLSTNSVASAAGPRLGDVNGGVVDDADLDIMARAYGLTERDIGFVPEADLDGSGIIDVEDFLLFMRGGFGRPFGRGMQENFVIGAGCVGDVDGDLDVDNADLAILLAAFGATEGSPGWVPRADLNGDGVIDVSDLSQLLATSVRIAIARRRSRWRSVPPSPSGQVNCSRRAPTSARTARSAWAGRMRSWKPG